MFILFMALIFISVCAFSFKESRMRAKLNLAILPSFNQGSTMAHGKRLC
ncbi:hypothetical protein NVP1191O_25 [Vibrio phage 1.191.O._10N.286.52.B4]|nr:hypothetical protein NVP1191O_25 [Vibrio phage 1.191.O._10N.286.52.B4]